jgi:DNA-binding MarR family transcriptional regulator
MDNKDWYSSPKKTKSFIDSRMNKMLKDKCFTASQIPYIMAIGETEGISLKQLSIVVGGDKGLTTRVTHTLIKNGLAVNNSESSKTYRLFLTDKGKEAYIISKETVEKTVGTLFECLDEDDIKHLRKISDKINKRLEELYEY